MIGRTNQMFNFNPKTQIWEEEKPGGFIPSPRSFLASCSWNDSFLIFGGQGQFNLFMFRSVFTPIF